MFLLKGPNSPRQFLREALWNFLGEADRFFLTGELISRIEQFWQDNQVGFHAFKNVTDSPYIFFNLPKLRNGLNDSNFRGPARTS
jgi:hypothetical protein